ncbi:uncharacterized protein [Nicotiana tomentosiformis]|uniref:uncharacterized protein n=1 Tax=Nicotiana tomentosiformis TaxID=4098 RepID=UPI00388C648F
MITIPAATPVVRPSIGGGQVSRDCPRGGDQPCDAPARFDAFLARPDAIFICSKDATVLFDPWSTYAYVSSLITHFLGVPRESLRTPLYVSMLVGTAVVVDQIYRSCIVNFYGYESRADLLLHDMTYFEVILGMDWLSPYHAVLDCHAKTFTLAIPKSPRLERKGSCVSTSSRVISFQKARRMVEKGCLAYLAYVRDTAAATPTIDSVPVVQEFSDVFPSDLPGMPPDRDIDICIDLAPVTQPISIPPYCMASKELKEWA